MRLHRLDISGFKRIHSATVEFGEATFLIGSNNAGKSSVLQAVEWLLSAKTVMDTSFYCSEADPETGENKISCKTITLEAEFRNVPGQSSGWRGFKGRVFNYDPGDSGETGKSIFYRKTYTLGESVVTELKSLSRTLLSDFSAISKPLDLVERGIDEKIIQELFKDLDKKISAADRAKLELIDEIWELSEDEVWDKNPGGISGVVLSKLPNFLLIPAESSVHEFDKAGVLHKTLNELFKDVRETSEHFKTAQHSLNLLAKELDPSDAASEFGKMMLELNNILSGVFPESRIYASADLSGPESLNPIFSIEMSSNIRTSIANQGTGMVRAAVFGLLRFRQQWLKKRGGNDDRGLIIGFEEPEIFLHPSAANQMRDLIYELSGGTSQIVATTHSPYLIDLSRKPKQVLNRFHYEQGHSTIHAFSVSEKFRDLQGNDKDQVKMLIKLDDHVSRIFFTRRVVVVEGDTEEVLIKEAIRRMAPELRAKVLSGSEIIKARGKAAIIGLVKYLNALNVNYFVIHDRDQGVAGAEVFNQPIADAVGNNDRVTMLHECVEDLIGYPAPSSEKPFKAYTETLSWGEDWDGVPQSLRDVMVRAFSPFI
ncbi:ATP-dependent nuclease [Pseudomonas asplenii]|uniref:ATP-dependent nuclease n=1 Tax=Pseudomonas asplenii TaxID=53407 RepID=UPI002234A702|nr:ATP-dependent endonuclease [Pseudomonas asplenii]UZE27017.1 ATP-dependent endonuclease [Pseudomonas asplenii]